MTTEINKYLMRINEIIPPDDQPTRLKLKGFPRNPDDKPVLSPAAKWVDEIYATLPKNPLNPDQLVMLFGEGEDQQIALFELEPTKHDTNTVYIKWFQAYPQRQGVGRKAMSKLQDMAREAGLKLNLTSWKMGKVPERVLNKFYKSMGFNPGARGLGGLTWDPKVDEGDVVPFARPTLKPDTQNLHLAKEIASELFWMQASTYGTAEEEAAERELEDRLAKMGYSAEWNTNEPEFNMVITHISSGKQYHMGEDELVGESWSNKYKKSIDCSNPKGFSQKAHCAARKKRAAGGHAKLGEATAGERALLRNPDSYFDTEMLDKVPLAKMRPTERGKKPDQGKTFPKIRPEEEIPNEDMVIKDMGSWGVFVLTGHFLKRMKQRKIPVYQAFGIINRVFGENRGRIKAIPSPTRFVVKDHTGLGMVVDKSEMSDGKIRYSFITAHPKWDIRVKDRIKENTLLDKPTLTVGELAKKHNVTAQDVLRELKKGVKVEQEHTSKLNVAREIALDHLGEDLYYYIKLARAEKSNG